MHEKLAAESGVIILLGCDKPGPRLSTLAATSHLGSDEAVFLQLIGGGKSMCEYDC